MDRVIPRIRQLVATPSVSRVDPSRGHGNGAVTELLASWLADEGWQVEIQPLCDIPPGPAGPSGDARLVSEALPACRPQRAGTAPPADPQGRGHRERLEPEAVVRSNLIATLGRGTGGLVLAGHTDTVPPDAMGWQHDPFRATEAAGRIYGLGTADMKSFFALALAATRDLRPEQLAQPLTLLATADEEISMGGARALVAEGLAGARYAVVGEPTSLRPARMHKGIVMQRLRLSGRSGHSSDPDLGVSALEGMHGVITELLAWRGELQDRYRDPLFAVPVPTLNLGHIHGGDNPNRICGHCEICFDLRPLPGMDLDELRGALGQRLAQRLEDSGLSLQIEDIYPGTPPLSTSASSPIVRTAARLTGYEPMAVAFATEAPYYQRLGVEPVVMGPGSIDQAHQPDEYIDVSSFAPTIEVLRGLIKTFCIEPHCMEPQEQVGP